MKKKTKTQAKAAPSQLAKLKEKVKQNYKNSTGPRKELIKLGRTCFKKNLSTAQGFGVQDLKPVYLALYMFLLTKYGNKLNVIPTNVNRDNLEIEFYTS